MNRRSVLAASVVSSFAGAALTAVTPKATHAAPPHGLGPGGAYDRFVAERAAQDAFSGTVLVARNGRTVLNRSHGMANKEQGRPNRADTVYWLASITKTFTALAIAQLVERGRMTFHDTLATHLDGFPADVTVHQLLTHTAGIGRPSVGGGAPQGLEWNSFEEVMDGTLAIVRQLPLQFTPGTRYAYSNDGYFVLGAIVARVAGQSYFDYVREQVFAPAGMAHARFYSRPEVLADDTVARPYATQRNGTRADFAGSPYAPFSLGPAGGAYSTAADLLAFARALCAGKLLGPAYVSLLTSGKYPLPTGFYGYGYMADIVGGDRIVGHSGSGPGAANRLDMYPELNAVSLVLSNYDTTIDPIVDLGRSLMTA